MGQERRRPQGHEPATMPTQGRRRLSRKPNGSISRQGTATRSTPRSSSFISARRSCSRCDKQAEFAYCIVSLSTRRSPIIGTSRAPPDSDLSARPSKRRLVALTPWSTSLRGRKADSKPFRQPPSRTHSRHRVYRRDQRRAPCQGFVRQLRRPPLRFRPFVEVDYLPDTAGKESARSNRQSVASRSVATRSQRKSQAARTEGDRRDGIGVEM